MARIVIVYGTGEGQTAKVSRHLKIALENEGHAVTLFDVEAIRPDQFDWQAVDGAIIGASVHTGRHNRHIVDFAKRYREHLESLPSAFFSVSMAAREITEQDKAEIEKYLAEFQRRTGWHPERMGEFAGAMLYSQYNPVIRFILRRIVRHTGGDLDSLRDHEYTDWGGVTEFAKTFSKSLEHQTA